MPDLASALVASKPATALLALFIPSKDRRNNTMAKNIDRIAAGLAAKVVGKVAHTGGGALALQGSHGSLQPFKPVLSLDKVSARAGQPMQVGYGIPKCR